ncbi:MAG TPA: GNAT family N-acetyltransferase [Bacteroidales bacterium]|nr:GNAT family N-acetyltransferase [Bacteroidales bacterium]HRZ75769.1 GNAT family N-acetyltransferase [Bacteroidales bacterium]
MDASILVIRPALREDAPAITAFQLAMAQETEGLELRSDTLAQGVSAVFDDPSKGTYFVAENGGLILSSLMVTPEWSDWRNGWVWWIQSVYVLPEWRGRGVYKAMYLHIQEQVLGRTDILGIRLYVDQRNTVAGKVYARLGMNGDHYALYEWMP